MGQTLRKLRYGSPTLVAMFAPADDGEQRKVMDMCGQLVTELGLMSGGHRVHLTIPTIGQEIRRTFICLPSRELILLTSYGHCEKFRPLFRMYYLNTQAVMLLIPLDKYRQDPTACVRSVVEKLLGYITLFDDFDQLFQDCGVPLCCVFTADADASPHQFEVSDAESGVEALVTAELKNNGCAARVHVVSVPISSNSPMNERVETLHGALKWVRDNAVDPTRLSKSPDSAASELNECLALS